MEEDEGRSPVLSPAVPGSLSATLTQGRHFAPCRSTRCTGREDEPRLLCNPVLPPQHSP